MAGEIAEESQADIDEEVGAAAGDEEDAEGWDEDCDDDDQDGGEDHGDYMAMLMTFVVLVVCC